MFCEKCGDDYYGEANGKLLCRKHYDEENIHKQILLSVGDCIDDIRGALNELKEIVKDHENRLKKLEGK